MKLETFKKLFPNADKSMFSEVEGTVVYDKLDDVEEPSFWDNQVAVFDLHLPYDDLISYYQNKQKYLEKVRLAEKKEKAKIPSWEPREFGISSSIPPIKLKTQNFNLENFRIYVSENEFFLLKDSFPDFSDTREINWNDEKNEYCVFLKAMYVLSYLGGMSSKNLKSENNLAKSLSYFYFYYHLKKFLNYRNFSQYNTTPLEKVEFFQSLYYWDHHQVYFHPHMNLSPNEFKRGKKDIVFDIRRDGKWIKWKTRGKLRDLSKDYLKLIQTSGQGLTKTGQALFQESNQAYVYCVLGAQAKTHWKIVGDGANSYQTQKVFHSLVKEILTQNDTSSLIKDMRIAIEDTKVRLNFCISPGLELLPSDMIYIKDSPGYNNILLLSASSNKFGVNNNVNKTKKRVTLIEKEKTSPPKEESKGAENSLETNDKQILPQPKNNTSILIEGSFIAAFARILWLALF